MKYRMTALAELLDGFIDHCGDVCPDSDRFHDLCEQAEQLGMNARSPLDSWIEDDIEVRTRALELSSSELQDAILKSAGLSGELEAYLREALQPSRPGFERRVVDLIALLERLQ